VCTICDTLLVVVAALGALNVSRLTLSRAEAFELCILFCISVWAAGCVVTQVRHGAQALAAAAAAPPQKAVGDSTATSSVAPAASMPHSLAQTPAAQSQPLDGEAPCGMSFDQPLAGSTMTEMYMCSVQRFHRPLAALLWSETRLVHAAVARVLLDGRAPACAATAVAKLQAAKQTAPAAAARSAPPIWAGRHGIKRVQVSRRMLESALALLHVPNAASIVHTSDIE